MNFARVKKVIVGSGNPAKIEAVGEALAELFPKAEFSGVEVERGVMQPPREHSWREVEVEVEVVLVVQGEL